MEGGPPVNVDPTAPGDVRFISAAAVRGGKQASVNGAMRVEAPDGVASIEVAGRGIWQNRTWSAMPPSAPAGALSTI